jgi:DNA invertase Pin-like site-specific DNA recombinase
MLIGYMRVSKSDGTQVLDLQRDALLQADVLAENLYHDFASGKNDDRQGLEACLKALRAGDTLIVWKLDRLGRNLHHLVNTVHELSSKDIYFKVLTGQGASIDTTTPQGLWSLVFLPHWLNLNATLFQNAPKQAWLRLVVVEEKAVRHIK